MSVKRPSSGAVNIKYMKEGIIKYGEAFLYFVDRAARYNSW
jgi:hypothetical protein